jgi:ribosomal protein S18 acetylase RimI-like enzyme
MPFTVRKANPQDTEELLRLWRERTDVYLKQQGSTTAAEQWREAVLCWLDRDDAAVLVADREGQLIGYMVGWVRENLPFTQPAQFGLISEMSVDGHCKQGGVGTALLDAMKAWFKAKDLHHIEVRVPYLQPIEQAFWRALGARDSYDLLTVKLD